MSKHLHLPSKYQPNTDQPTTSVHKLTRDRHSYQLVHRTGRVKIVEISQVMYHRLLFSCNKTFHHHHHHHEFIAHLLISSCMPDNSALRKYSHRAATTQRCALKM